MRTVATLLDKARETCRLPSDNTLAQRLGVSRSIVSAWRADEKRPSDDHIATLAKLAHEDEGDWIVTLRASWATGEARRAWAALARRLGTAALVLTLMPFRADAYFAGVFDGTASQVRGADSLYIMRTSRCRRIWLGICHLLRFNSLRHSPQPV